MNHFNGYDDMNSSSENHYMMSWFIDAEDLKIDSTFKFSQAKLSNSVFNNDNTQKSQWYLENYWDVNLAKRVSENNKTINKNQ